MTNALNWFELSEACTTDSPALLVFPERVMHNIQTALQMVNGNTDRLQPHIKTCKSAEPIKLMMAAGIYKFKCATIAEAELLANCGVKEVLMAYQAIGPKLKRLIELINKFPATSFSFLSDNLRSAKEQAEICTASGITGSVYADINVGMNRTGIATGDEALKLYRFCNESSGLKIKGLHVYDGHIRNPDFELKKQEAEMAFQEVELLIEKIKEQELPEPEIICGGSPSFSVHAKRENVVCSPGTFIYWDQGYKTICPEQNFLPAIVIFTRIISKPVDGLISLDAGHKAMAAENEIGKRLFFLNAENLKPVSQSEEHLVLQQEEEIEYEVGDCLYALPYHVCPTVNLYDRVLTVENNKVTGDWKNSARDRLITF
ncbi:MAG: D-TA family PLP-dependent enzyme [Chitinophagaceae bacterium]